MAKPPKQPNLPKFELVHNKAKNRWDLNKEGGARPTRTFERKADATAGGILGGAVGKGGGSVRIKKTDGTYQEERTYPGSRDPKGSPG